MTKELIIQNLSTLSEILEYIKNNFQQEQDKQENIIVRFDDNITVDELLESLRQLWQLEFDSNHNFDILIKNLSYEHRKSALGLGLQTSNLTDPNFLSNIFCLIKGYNTFSDAYFAHEQVFLNDEIEFLDIFDDLEKEISEVTLKMAEYYVSMLKTCNLVDAVESNPNAVKLDNLYSFLFNAVDVTILAKILSSVKDPAIWETKKIVLGALDYLGAIAEKFVFTNTLLDMLITKNSESQ